MLSHTTQNTIHFFGLCFFDHFFFFFLLISFFCQHLPSASLLSFHLHTLSVFRCRWCIVESALLLSYCHLWMCPEYRVCGARFFGISFCRHSRTIEFWFSRCDASRPKMSEKLQFKRVLNDRHISTMRIGRTHKHTSQRVIYSIGWNIWRTLLLAQCAQKSPLNGRLLRTIISWRRKSNSWQSVSALHHFFASPSTSHKFRKHFESSSVGVDINKTDRISSPD